MSNILRDAAESTMHVAESTLQTVAELVEDAYQHIELPGKRHSSNRQSWILVLLAAVAVVGVVAFFVRRSKASGAVTTDAAKTDVAAEHRDSKSGTAATEVAGNGRAAREEQPTA